MEEKKIYETPDAEFVELEEEDVVVASLGCTGGRGTVEVDD